MEKNKSQYDFDPKKDIKEVKPQIFHSWEKASAQTTQNFDLDPESFGGEDFPSWDPNGPQPLSPLNLGPIVTPEEEDYIKKLYENNPQLKNVQDFTRGSLRYHSSEAWIQTYSGRRFNPTNPIVEAIVIQDIAHSLSMQCRFSGHCKEFYSVAQHSVLVSYICNFEDAFWGLMHDASEAYLVDVPRPIKHSGKFGAYIEMENEMQKAICNRFHLPHTEPESVKRADKTLLATEARDLMSPLRPDWVQPCSPLPFKIEALGPAEAERLFMKRFFELTDATSAEYERYFQ